MKLAFSILVLICIGLGIKNTGLEKENENLHDSLTNYRAIKRAYLIQNTNLKEHTNCYTY